MSCALTRILFPILRTLPSRTADTSSRLPIALMSSVVPLKAKVDVRDATPSDLIFESALMISSAMPSVKYSFSGSLLVLVKGSTAIDLTTCAPSGAGVAVGVVTIGGTIALANSLDVVNRLAESCDIALVTAASVSSGMSFTFFLRDGAGSVNRLLRTA